MKRLRALCLLCAAALFFCSSVPAFAETAENHQAASYAHILKDYILTYGVMETQFPGQRLPLSQVKNSLVYAQYIDFEPGKPPCLVLFLTDLSYKVASCHIWQYSEETGKAQRIGIIDRKLTVSGQQSGEFGIGSMTGNGQSCIVYTSYEEDHPSAVSCFAALNGQLVKYVNSSQVSAVVGVLDFNAQTIHPGIDISSKNKQLTGFYDTLKKEVVQTSLLPNQLKSLASAETASLRTVISSALPQENFDLLDIQEESEYKKILSRQDTSTVTLYSISSIQDIGNSFYRISFSTNQSLSNDAIVYNGQNGCQLLYLALDTIPLSDRELIFLKKQYQQHPLLPPPSAAPLLEKKEASPLPVRNIRIWTACIGSGISMVLLLWLWFFLGTKRKAYSPFPESPGRPI